MLEPGVFLDGVPSRALTGNLEFRTLPLCSLSYGDDLNANHRGVRNSAVGASVIERIARRRYFRRGIDNHLRASMNSRKLRAKDPLTKAVRRRLEELGVPTTLLE